jgi:hypothetical protein
LGSGVGVPRWIFWEMPSKLNAWNACLRDVSSHMQQPSDLHKSIAERDASLQPTLPLRALTASKLGQNVNQTSGTVLDNPKSHNGHLVVLG